MSNRIQLGIGFYEFNFHQFSSENWICIGIFDVCLLYNIQSHVIWTCDSSHNFQSWKLTKKPCDCPTKSADNFFSFHIESLIFIHSHTDHKKTRKKIVTCPRKNSWLYATLLTSFTKTKKDKNYKSFLRICK
jgi:hypothetical protein